MESGRPLSAIAGWSRNTGSGATFSTVQGSLLIGNTPYDSSSTNLNCSTFVGNDTTVALEEHQLYYLVQYPSERLGL